MADDLNDAALASATGSQKLVDTEAAKAAYIWGVVGLALSAFDIFISGKAVLGLLKVTKAVEGVSGAGKLVHALDERTFLKLSKLDPENINIVFKASVNLEETSRIIKALTNKGLNNIAKIDNAEDLKNPIPLLSR